MVFHTYPTKEVIKNFLLSPRPKAKTYHIQRGKIDRDSGIHGSLNRRHLTPGVEAVFEAGGTFLDFRSKLPPKGKYQNGEPNSYPITADFT